MKRILALTSLAIMGCGPVAPETGAIDLAPHGSATWRGLSVQHERIHLVAEGRGLVELSLDGALVAEHRVGDAGLLDAPYRDVAALDAAYVLLADDQGFLYDPQAGSETVHFCVPPGDVIGPAQKQRNDAVAVDDELIYANPRFYDVDDVGNETGLATSELRTYRLSDGSPTTVVPLERPLELHGLAIANGGILGVQGDTVVALDAQGRILRETSIEGLEAAAGIAVDATHAYLLDDEHDRIAIVALEDLQMKRALLLAFTAGSLACAPDAPVLNATSTIEPAQVVGDAPIRGISLHDDGFDVLADGLGILTVARDGSLVRAHAPGEAGMWSTPYSDVAYLGGDRFVLLADVEGYLYDAGAQQQRVHFCVEPGFEPGPAGPVITQRNEAVAANDDVIVAAPRFYEDGVLQRSAINTYDASTGEPRSSVEVTSDIELTGLALGERIYGVQAAALHVFSANGAHEATYALAETTAASGIALLDDGALVVVEDASATARLYEIDP